MKTVPMAQSFRTNLTNFAIEYLQLLKIPVTKTSLKESLEQNPYYPTLYSLGNTFNKFNIENIAFDVPVENLDELQTPFITYCSSQSTGKDFVLVTKVTPTTVSYIAEGKTEKQIKKQDFLSQWQKIAFAAEANVQSGEKDYLLKLKAEKAKRSKQQILYFGLGLIVGLLVYWLIANTDYTITARSVIAIKFLSVAVTAMLLLAEIKQPLQ